MRRMVTWLAGAALAFQAVLNDASAATFEKFTGFRPTGRSAPFRYASLSADGLTVVGSAYIGSPFRWTRNEGLTYIDESRDGEMLTNITDVSADGSTILGATDLGHWVLWDNSGGVKQLSNFGFAPVALSGDGATAVGHERSSGQGPRHAVQWLPDSPPSLLGSDLVSVSTATDVSGDGSVIVGWVGANTNDRTGFLWQTGDDELLPLPPLPTGENIAFLNAVSNNGKHALGAVVVDSRPQAVILREGELPVHLNATLDILATGISDDGNTVVGVQGGAFDRAFIWDPNHGVRDLRDVLANDYGLADEIGDWMLTDIRGLSADGRTILGIAQEPIAPNVFVERLYIATIPEPSTAALLVTGTCLGLIAYRVGRKSRSSTPPMH